MLGRVGPTGYDISLPKEQVVHRENQDPSLKHSQKTTISTPHKTSFLSFRQLNCLAVIIVLSASGLVSAEDFAFVVFSLIYLYFLSWVAFPRLPSNEPRVFVTNKKFLRLHMFIGSVIGLYLPIAYILEGVFGGDKQGIKAAATHVFLLVSQVYMEGVAFSDSFATPISAFVPVFYNSRRIFTIVDWLRTEIYKVEDEHSGPERRVYIGIALAVANMAFWCFNLFGFLLPVFLPRAFKMYYSGLGEE